MSVPGKLAIVFAAVSVAGCGATPPQAPFHQAQRLDVSTGGISTACGESYQIRQFEPGDHRGLATLEATALHEARKLASVNALNPQWIYQGETVRQIVAQAVTYLQQCGLSAAAAPLVHR